jgi:hypothetical protein
LELIEEAGVKGAIAGKALREQLLLMERNMCNKPKVNFGQFVCHDGDFITHPQATKHVAIILLSLFNEDALKKLIIEMNELYVEVDHSSKKLIVGISWLETPLSKSNFDETDDYQTIEGWDMDFIPPQKLSNQEYDKVKDFPLGTVGYFHFECKSILNVKVRNL